MTFFISLIFCHTSAIFIPYFYLPVIFKSDILLYNVINKFSIHLRSSWEGGGQHLSNAENDVNSRETMSDMSKKAKLTRKEKIKNIKGENENLCKMHEQTGYEEQEWIKWKIEEEGIMDHYRN